MSVYFRSDVAEALYDWVTADAANAGGWKWLGLLDDSGVEVTGSGYARQELLYTGDITDTMEYDGIQEYMVNKNIFFTGIDVGTIVTSWRLYEASTGGTAVLGNDFSSTETIISGGNYVADAGEIVLALRYSTFYGIGPMQTVATWMAGLGELFSDGDVPSIDYYWSDDLPSPVFPGPQRRWGSTYVSEGYVPTFEAYGTVANGGRNLTKGIEVPIDEAFGDPDITIISLSRGLIQFFYDVLPTPLPYDLGDFIELDAGDLTITVVGTDEPGITAVLEIGASAVASAVTPTVATTSALVAETIEVDVNTVEVSEHRVPLLQPGSVQDILLLVDTGPVAIESSPSTDGWGLGFLPI